MTNQVFDTSLVGCSCANIQPKLDMTNQVFDTSLVGCPCALLLYSPYM
jgi:hypothetical protein